MTDRSRCRQQRAEVTRGRDLTGMRARRDQLVGEGGTGAEHRLEAHGADDVGGQRQPQRVVVRERPDPRHELRAVEEGQALLRPERERLEAGARQRLAPGGRPCPVDGRLALADEHEGDVRQRGEVARRAEAAARRDDRVDGGVQHGDEERDDIGPHAGQADRQGIRAQHHHRPHHLVGQRGRRCRPRGSGRGCAAARRCAAARCGRRRGRRSRSSPRRRWRHRRRGARSRRGTRASDQPRRRRARRLVGRARPR